MKKKSAKVKAAIASVRIKKADIEEVLGECHDGEDLKLLMKDGTVKIVSKAEIDEE